MCARCAEKTKEHFFSVAWPEEALWHASDDSDHGLDVHSYVGTVWK